MSLTKEQLIDAYEQGLSINTKNGNIKIVTILGDVYGVNHCDTNSKLVKWWMFENFERNHAKIEQPKPKIDLSILKEGEIYYAKGISTYEYIFIFDSIDDYKIIVKKGLSVQDNFITGTFLAKKNQLIELRLPTESELELFYSKFPELKPKKYNGRAVKCDTVEQFIWLLNKLESKHLKYGKENYEEKFNCIDLTKGTLYTTCENFDYYDKRNYEIISFSQYYTENGIVEPKWIQGFEVGKDYNDVVFVSDDNENWYLEKLIAIKKHPIQGWQFETQLTYYKYCRYPRKGEINEIKFVD